ncbi:MULTISPECIES: D-alanine--D-alanine ligase [Psychrilyobacter]|uniref:D-alanine--D-alanine ligase n=1 Tax=Psychrilyobacter piezotolerans TaxID=2293438 RepID=A0ABX9KFG2_9FUSO|nr:MULTISPECIES: D-alanine--D-alanine ligase [Psychrilyobacter]MCS5421552.1 D-alanine--D-alanine ligase [Psychrilyobacter sp. S5]NDI78675.1 D-alanine--D-alanine ligase [Psychrilyobacter piezotolerans]RDE60026.1 D-alanine--D-alanine ligase [Psychrilyobacter sp. S5]REI40253.1 D-alanine--D-alanine ligase [Psychrilyobacter piezotolerans]
MRIAVLMGGVSSEREISLMSGGAILQGLLNLGYDAFKIDLVEENYLTALMENEYDLAYVALHGEFGEDGRVQAVLDILKKPYTGSGVTASAVSMDKVLTKIIVDDFGIKTPMKYTSIDEVEKYPIVIKPSKEGSSVGLYICQNSEEAYLAVEKLKGIDLVIEEFIAGEELTAGILNGEKLGVVKIIPNSGTYDFESKYTVGKTIYEVPAIIEENYYEEAMEIASKVHDILNLRGMSRSDFILSKDGLYFLEVNTSPGMTTTSLLPKLGKLKGYSFETILEKIVSELNIL